MNKAELDFAKKVSDKKSEEAIAELESQQQKKLNGMLCDLLSRQQKMLKGIVDNLPKEEDNAWVLNSGLMNAMVDKELISPEQALDIRQKSYLGYMDSTTKGFDRSLVKVDMPESKGERNDT